MRVKYMYITSLLPEFVQTLLFYTCRRYYSRAEANACSGSLPPPNLGPLTFTQVIARLTLKPIEESADYRPSPQRLIHHISARQLSRRPRWCVNTVQPDLYGVQPSIVRALVPVTAVN